MVSAVDLRHTSQRRANELPRRAHPARCGYLPQALPRGQSERRLPARRGGAPRSRFRSGISTAWHGTPAAISACVAMCPRSWAHKGNTSSASARWPFLAAESTPGEPANALLHFRSSRASECRCCPVPDACLGRAAVVSATLDALLSWQGEAGAHVGSRPSLTGLLQNCRPALAGIIGARREFTAAMISSVSIPCR
jgi:hypothetical protein